ncbi:signal peptidase II [Candidatus Epulonipiscium fishelsonii]|uniref:Signal peptidase II n=1 Tax=Candidatus Epulonipiscium fishelsonii TaxID=77094 RepID=A0ACC8XDE5_9FIRM|nr:signal peptidase II [Epulopiscium sp. SCG-B05WGA-EpuloA1]ONI40964.1 signal peptidase II [Epulopiscium sp. SCG-B11WGA-EpuloA1]ONI47315.1 signal peptidase II [Epulopiscium sp. SCG-C06WGA-EpuloA1]
MQMIGIIFIVSFLVIVDQIVKYWTVSTLKVNGPIEVWPDVFHLTYVENRGAAFGMLQNRQWFFVIITVIVLIAIIIYWRHIPNDKIGKWTKIALLFTISGAIGNLIDRLRLEFVVDMFYFKLIDFPVFNVADICVVTGTILLIPLMLLSEDKKSE